MRPGCLILTATILRSSIKASRRQNIVHQGGATSCWLNTSRSGSSFTPYTEHLKLIADCCLRKPKSVRCRQIPARNLTGNVGANQDGRNGVDEKLGFPSDIGTSNQARVLTSRSRARRWSSATPIICEMRDSWRSRTAPTSFMVLSSK